MVKGSTEVVRTPMALYRQYRPGSFAEVRGQESVVSVLKAAVEKGEPAHAYLFAGGRGTGKTSMARLLARALQTDEKDIYEMDAASNRGIDEIRELRDGVATLPFSSKYKFYIIDEAHALTKDAWGALLKTLEEPPSHVIFVLATTELDRVPETILSRCQVFRFKKPSQDVLKKLVLDVAKKEETVIEPAGAELIAMMGDGSFRDTLGILQKVLTVSSDKKLSAEEVGKVVGAPAGSLVNEFIKALAEKNIEAAIAGFHKAVAQGAEPNIFVLLTMAKIRAILLMRYAPKMESALQDQFSEEDLALIKDFAGQKGVAINSAVLAELITALLEMSRAPVPAISLELALYRLFS